MTETNKTPVSPLPSSTVMVLRPLAAEASNAEAGFELFMVRRHAKSRFMPDRYVFPGGRLEEGDSQPAALARLHGYDINSTTPLFRDLPGQGAYEAGTLLSRAQEAGMCVAAFRELFEEAGVLLAVQEESGERLDLQSDDRLLAHFAAYRQAMQTGQPDAPDFITMLEREKLLLDLNGLIYFSHWITPTVEPYRFDARFFLTQVPLDQLATSDNLETTDGVWITPREALDRAAAEQFNIAYPTLLHVEWLANYSSSEAACAAARTKTVVPVMPTHYTDEDGNMVFQMPEDVVGRW